MTKDKSCKLRINLRNWDDIAGYAEYEHFNISDQTDGFRLTAIGYTGTAGKNSILFITTILDFSHFERTRQIIRYRATATLRRPQLKRHTASK